MNNKLLCALAFAAGAATGALVSWKLLKTRYEQIAREEIESVKEVYSVKKAEPEIVDYDEPEDLEPKNLKEIVDHVAKNVRGTDYSNIIKPYTGETEEDDVKAPYVISPDEFGELDYTIESLTYQADGILADDRDFVIDDIEGTVGEASLETFGKYEEDSVFVRNDHLETDYEILLDERKYCDVTHSGQSPSEE